MPSHDARVRYCIQVGIPREFLRDDIRCPACDEMHQAMHLDPDVAEILTREPWCESCAAGHKPQLNLRSGTEGNGPTWKGCKVPPDGWWCSREAGHEGPCAARPGTEGSTD